MKDDRVGEHVDRERMEHLADPLEEAYGDDPVAVMRNGMLGVARKRKMQKVKDKEVLRAKVTKLVASWEGALTGQKGAVIDWLMKKLD